jgi:hypothetical protein
LNYRPRSRAASSKTCAFFFAEKNSVKREEIAAHQLHALKQHYDGKLRLTDVKEMFVQMRDHA